VSARVLTSMVAGVFGGKVAARTTPAFVRSVDEIAGQRVARVERWDAFLCSAR
jgi:hypothetical protein